MDVKSKSNNKSLQHQAIELFNQGMNISKIAKMLDFSRNAILMKILPENLVTNRIQEYLIQGMTYTEIGSRLSIDPKTVKIRATKARITDTNTAEIVELFLNEVPINEIAQILNMNNQQVINKIPEEIRKKRLETLYIDYQLSYKQLGEQLGISRTSLKNWLRRYNLMNRHANAGKEFKIYPKRESSETISNCIQLNQ